jgi:RNA polymerase sigma-70 factor (ECF subfamily)
MSAHAFSITPEEWESFRRKLAYKVRFHVGNFCPDIEDLVQETLTRFHRALNDKGLRQPESIGSFLNGICKNVILEYRRRLWREIPYDTERHPECSAPPPTRILEMRDTIETALESLGERDRTILTAFYLEEQEKDEICRTMGLTDAQFRVIICRAKERMRKLLLDAPATSGM